MVTVRLTSALTNRIRVVTYTSLELPSTSHTSHIDCARIWELSEPSSSAQVVRVSPVLMSWQTVPSHLAVEWPSWSGSWANNQLGPQGPGRSAYYKFHCCFLFMISNLFLCSTWQSSLKQLKRADSFRSQIKVILKHCRSLLPLYGINIFFPPIWILLFLILMW